jgi:hypothetical membrane protein
MAIPPRTGAWAGILLVLVWVGLYLVAAVAAVRSPYGYNVVDYYLSDLGNPAAPAPWAFNAGDILAGLLAIPFGLALAGTVPRVWGRVAGTLVVLAGVSLVGVGAFPEGSPYGLHGTFSLAFFLLLTIALGVVIRPFFRPGPYRPLAAWVTVGAFALNVVLVVTWVANVGDPQLSEHLGVFSALGWTGTTSFALWHAPTATTQPRAAPA